MAGMLVSGLSGCNDYLDEQPSKNENLEITTAEQLEALLNKNAFGEKTLDQNTAQLFCSDCFEMTTAQYTGMMMMDAQLLPSKLQTWRMDLTGDANKMTAKWTVEYQRIYLANLVLFYADRVSGSAQLREEVKARAHAMRAYCYIELANTYCQPYGRSTLQTPGLPLKGKPEFEDRIGRATLEETYQFIEQDLAEALKQTRPLVVNGKRESWMESAAMVNATAARFYLNKGDYARAESYAKAALALGNDQLDLQTDITVEQSLNIFTGTFSKSTSAYAQTSSSKTFCADLERAYYLRETYYMGHFTCWPIPSQYLLSLYDKKYDLRYKDFIYDDFQNVYFMGIYGKLFLSNVPGYTIFNSLLSNGPTAAEMLLTQAECLARQNKVSEAMTLLNDFRRKRFSSDAPANLVNLNAADSKAAVKLILEERAREFPFTQRWNDIRRINFNDDPGDDVMIKRHFYTVAMNALDMTKEMDYELTPQTPERYAMAIPDAEISSSGGGIVQNAYK